MVICLYSSIGRYFKMAFPKLIYRFIVIPIRIAAFFFAEIDKLILKLIWKLNRLQNSKKNLEIEQLSWRSHTS